MEAKDTVMSIVEVGKVWREASAWRKLHEGMEVDKNGDMTGMLQGQYGIAKEQAEISYKAGLKQGIWLFAWWKDGEQYVGTSGKTLKEAYKELGIE